ncbi:MAG: bifunctional oligoribonuclease/PAP phosphatase NrnA [Acidobacteriota bacterium]
MKEEIIKKFQDLVSRNSRFLLTVHLNADGDAIGSEIALCKFLKSKGKIVHLLNQEPLPEAYQFLCGDCSIEVFDPELHGSLFESADVIFLIDNSTPGRFAAMKDYLLGSRALKICIDHHPESNPVWDFNIIIDDACATGEIIYDLLIGMGQPIPLDIAQSLYAAIITDTGHFRFSITNARTHEIVSHLVRIGVNPQKVYQEVYERIPLEYIRLMGCAFENVTREDEGKIAHIDITREMIDRCSAHHIDTSDILNPILTIDRVKVAVLFKELADGRSKVSLRSKGDVDVNLLASEFGGGGHKNASGIVMNEGLEEAKRKILARLRKAFSS